MTSIQPSLFETATLAQDQPGGDPADPAWPEGFRYQAGLLSDAEAEDLLAQLASLPFKPFEFRGYTGKRQVVSFGWRYDFNHARLDAAQPIPAFLDPVRRRAAAFAGLAPERLEQVLINSYEPGAGIGWHCDRPQFEDVIGVSLGAPGRLRFRRRRGTGWARAAAAIAPRSAYLLRGPSRTDWEHSLPEVEAQRYSITFRTFRPGLDPGRREEI
ncbi:MAG: alpha-ketoglutarate-dependent dioxygenase AlkB [Caulobacteraceae bacterium]